MLLLLLSFYILTFICYYLWLLSGLIGFLGSSITRFFNFCDTFIASLLSLFDHQRSIAGKDVTTSRYLRYLRYFLKTQKAQAFHCILLKNTKVQTEESQEEEMAVKEIMILVSPLQFQYLLKILPQRSSILRLAEGTISTKMCGFPLLAMKCEFPSFLFHHPVP